MTKFEKFSNALGRLSTDEMKNVKGGACGYSVTINGVSIVDCNVSQSVAQNTASSWGGNWCCSSCGGSSYCHQV